MRTKVAVRQSRTQTSCAMQRDLVPSRAAETCGHYQSQSACTMGVCQLRHLGPCPSALPTTIMHNTNMMGDSIKHVMHKVVASYSPRRNTPGAPWKKQTSLHAGRYKLYIIYHVPCLCTLATCVMCARNLAGHCWTLLDTAGQTGQTVKSTATSKALGVAKDTRAVPL